jgi:hypothetical protein
MNFHNTAGMYDDIAKWLEEHDVEVDWEAIMQCKWWVGPKDWVPPPKWSMPAPFPSRLTPPIATKLLLAQWWNGLRIRPEIGDPLDDYVPPRISDHQNAVPKCEQLRGGEGVDPGLVGEAATGPSSWKIFIKQLAAIDRIEVIELKLLRPEDRKMLVRMAWIEEELRRREIEHNCERVRRQASGEAKWYLSRKREGWLREKASHGSMEAIEEMERRGYGSMEEHMRWRELNQKLVKNMAKTRMKKEEAKKASESSGGEADTEARGAVMGAAVRLEEPAGLLPEVAEAGREAGKESAGMMDEAVADKGVEMEPVKTGIERELEVIRVGPNPRILTCRYKELASERVCKVGVRSVANFVRGMRFKMAEPLDELEYAGVWRYDGRLPRLRGRW